MDYIRIISGITVDQPDFNSVIFFGLYERLSLYCIAKPRCDVLLQKQCIFKGT